MTPSESGSARYNRNCPIQLSLKEVFTEALMLTYCCTSASAQCALGSGKECWQPVPLSRSCGASSTQKPQVVAARTSQQHMMNL